MTASDIRSQDRKEKEKMFIQINNMWSYNVYRLKLKLSKLFIPTKI